MLNNTEIKADLTENAQNNSEFDLKVSESLKKVENQKIETVAKKRGRPRKYNPDGTPIGQAPENQTAATPTPDISQFLEAPLIGISKIPAAKYSCPEMALTQDEAKAIAESLNGVLNAFFPTLDSIDPKMMSLFVLGTTCGSIAMSKVMIYQEKQAEKVKTEVFETKISENKAQSAENQAAQVPQGTIPAQEYFKRF